MNNNFEKAFDRLEAILKSLDESQVSLDDSIKLFEEADALIKDCDKYLTSAEQKIEMLIKNHKEDSRLELDAKGKPKTEELLATNHTASVKDTEKETPF